MEQGILIVAVLCIFGLGFYIDNKIDLFLDNTLENRKKVQKRELISSKTLFLDDFSDDELLKEIHECKSRYSEAKIIIFDSQSEDIEKLFDHTTITWYNFKNAILEKGGKQNELQSRGK